MLNSCYNIAASIMHKLNFLKSKNKKQTTNGIKKNENRENERTNSYIIMIFIRLKN